MDGVSSFNFPRRKVDFEIRWCVLISLDGLRMTTPINVDLQGSLEITSKTRALFQKLTIPTGEAFVELYCDPDCNHAQTNAELYDENFDPVDPTPVEDDEETQKARQEYHAMRENILERRLKAKSAPAPHDQQKKDSKTKIDLRRFYELERRFDGEERAKVTYERIVVDPDATRFQLLGQVLEILCRHRITHTGLGGLTIREDDGRYVVKCSLDS